MKIKQLIKKNDFWMGLLYLSSFIFQIMLVVSVLYSLSSQLHVVQLLFLMFCGICNWFVFIRILEVVEIYKRSIKDEQTGIEKSV